LIFEGYGMAKIVINFSVDEFDDTELFEYLNKIGPRRRATYLRILATDALRSQSPIEPPVRKQNAVRLSLKPGTDNVKTPVLVRKKSGSKSDAGSNSGLAMDTGKLSEIGDAFFEIG
jgi:hypothetical protein